MKAVLLVISLMFFGYVNSQETFSDFDSKLSNIAQEFRIKIMDKNECEKLKKNTENLIDDIDNVLNNKKKSNEIYELIKLKKEAEALIDFMWTIGNCGNYILNIDNFNLANKRVNANINYIIKDKYCVDIILINIGNYVTYLAYNNTNNNYTVFYKWKAQNSMTNGYGTIGILKHSFRHIYDNRDKKEIKNIIVYSIKCKKFKYK